MTHSRIPLIALTLVPLLGSCGRPAAPLTGPGRDERVRRSLEQLTAGGTVPGVQYVVVDSAGTRFEYAGGWADVAVRVPMNSGTTLMAYSMTKTITAAAVLQLVERGTVGLDEPIGRYLPGTPHGDIRAAFSTASIARSCSRDSARLPSRVPHGTGGA